eukprot:TRINITY_DN8667_c0_g1_i1.p1 TRINITY_DN8667_c0_g1~~TRINITY_DN8667_c0_g1_i1.p1  ORF type:complete len:385 (+),score=96.80 TRINITY_DN8667_c0_g1_i1:86-1240(+)
MMFDPNPGITMNLPDDPLHDPFASPTILESPTNSPLHEYGLNQMGAGYYDINAVNNMYYNNAYVDMSMVQGYPDANTTFTVDYGVANIAVPNSGVPSSPVSEGSSSNSEDDLKASAIAKSEYPTNENGPLPLSAVVGPPTKKRKLEDSKIDDDIGFVTLTRQQLLSISSAELEAHVNNLKAQRSLTSAEQKEIKRQRRLIKNREYAQASRRKKKLAQQELKTSFDTVNAENTNLKKENGLLKNRVYMLECENQKLLATIEQLQRQNQPLPEESTKNANDFENGWGVSSDSFMMQGMCLFGVFLFAIFFSLGTNNEVVQITENQPTGLEYNQYLERNVLEVSKSNVIPDTIIIPQKILTMEDVIIDEMTHCNDEIEDNCTICTVY